MKRSVLVTLLAAFALLLPQQAWGIVYGQPDNGEHPNVGSFIGTVTDPDTGETALIQFCTGTLIDTDVVLSASHCLVGLEQLGITDVHFTLEAVIDADRDGLVDPDVTLLTGTPVTHPLHGTPGANLYDIAVFLLDDPVTGVTPAQLPEIGLLDDRSLRDATFTAVGYGAVRETNRKAFQSIRGGWRREQADQHLLSVTKVWATFSMNLATGNGGTCYGDSGGPHFLGDVVVSVTVTGDRFCKATDTTYRIDTPWAHDFLGQYVDLP